MKKMVVVALMVVLMVVPLFAQGSRDTKTSVDPSSQVYPKGTILIWSTGQPQFRKMYYQDWLERNRDIAPEVNIEVETIATMADGQQRLGMYALSGDYSSMPEVIMLDTVGIVELSSAGLLQDLTDYYLPIADQFVDGAASDATVNGRIFGLPDAVRPQLLFYNAAIFEKYNIDPAMMSTFDGYYEAGKLLKERSNGKVFLSYIDPSTFTWRYWGRRGLMPQANARIWDEQGNIVIGSDPGTKLALNYLDKLNNEGLLYKTRMFQQPLYEATDDGIIATYYIGAFWDEFMRKNITRTAGDWRVMNAPVFKEIGTGGAPVSTSFCLVDTKTNEYTELFKMLWYDFQTDTPTRNAWVAEMEKINGPYSNPVAKNVLEDPFWQEPSDFYGGQSFRKAEGDGLANSSKNMMVTASDAEADAIISAELEKYVAGELTMAQAIANMDRELKLKVRRAKLP
jgi:multiple sugar transport system substrate-binding protein